MTSDELRQAVCNLASGEENSTDRIKYWREAMPNAEGHLGIGVMYPKEWCGAFTLWALRIALGCTWEWEVGKGYLYRLRITTTPDLGDICYMDRPYQHHAILTAIGTGEHGEYVISQDGNQGPFPSVVLEQWRARSKWTAFYSIEPLVQAALEMM
jgi:hypothetical protein